jgi:hypothetical protein
MRLFLAVLIMVSASLHTDFASAAKTPKLKADRIQISYVAPKNPAHEPVYRLLKERQLLEKFQKFLSPLRLPKALQLKLQGCDGVSNAWYEDDAITICYEYIDDILKSAPKETTPAGVTRSDAIVGPTLEVVLHEVGHAVFDYLGVPVLGREEDAADQFAAYLLLQFAKADARRLIVGVAFAYSVDAARPITKKNPFADEHGFPQQRFYNLLCMAYGADEKLFADLVEKGHLPKERAEGCAGEYEQVDGAMTKLIRPYIDQARAKQVRAARWLQFDVPAVAATGAEAVAR